ncbi:MAG: hypothetical protein AAF317_05485 [Pseudomonadota bacterium]
MPSDIWVITSYFNPCGYRTRRVNYDVFREHISASGAPIFLVELATETGDFELPAPDYGLRIRDSGLLWQKERMLSVAVERLPPQCKKVVWIDCDVIFENPDWLESTSAALEEYAVIQPFAEAVRLPRGARQVAWGAEVPRGSAVQESFGAAFARDPSLARNAPFVAHGHTGLAWAARRDLLEDPGLYDACLTGSGDHLMAHVFAGALQSPCIPAMIGKGHAYAGHFARWADAMHDVCKGRLGHLPGRLFHLWHGDEENRRYRQHNTAFRAFDFDPERDIRKGAEGLWEWADASREMRDWAREMLQSRKEDG